MRIFKKKNASLIIGFAIPVLMILFVAASIYLPGLFLQPKYNFLYSTGGDYYYGNQIYTVSNGHVMVVPQPTPVDLSYRIYPSPQLYVHNVATNESTPISFENAQNLNLNSNVESPDGFRLENSSEDNGFFPFFSYNNDYTAQYLVGHNVSKKLNIKSNTSDYNSIHFLGWIMQ